MGPSRNICGMPGKSVPPVPSPPLLPSVGPKLKLSLASTFHRGAACECCAGEECTPQGGSLRVEFSERNLHMEYGENGEVGDGVTSGSDGDDERLQVLKLPMVRLTACMAPPPCLEPRAWDVPA